ncbi:MAG TPA: inorganic diphosphatase [Thermomicrobiales bacterium]|jgi:inorganic pyrophosphatase|nr:inorganic diphosphatase [Thermomicrobiales bacterium]
MSDLPTQDVQSDHAKQIHAEAIEVADETDNRTVLAFIETPKGSRNKYEYDKERGALRLDRVLFSSVHYPADYGFIPDTHWDDGDPIDILVLMNEPSFPGCLIDARPVGGLDMRDEKGDDFKVVAVPTHDPRYNNIQGISDLASHILKEIANFFETYKILEEKETQIMGWHDVDETLKRIARSRELYRELQATTATT